MAKQPTPEHAPEPAHALAAAGCDAETAEKVMAIQPQSGLSFVQILELARRVPWDKVMALLTALASRDPVAIFNAVLAIITSIQTA